MDLINGLGATLDAIQSQTVWRPKIDPHYHAKKDTWTMTAWKQDEVTFNPRHIIDEIEGLERELYDDLMNHRITCPRPKYLDVQDNILTLDGLTQSAKRDTAEVSTSNRYFSLGSNATTATENDHGLGTEFVTAPYARKDLTVEGSRKVYNQTAKYGVMFDDGDVPAPPIDIKEAGLHWASSGANNCHAHVTFTTFSMVTGDLFVIQVNELQENG